MLSQEQSNKLDFLMDRVISTIGNLVIDSSGAAANKLTALSRCVDDFWKLIDNLKSERNKEDMLREGLQVLTAANCALYTICWLDPSITDAFIEYSKEMKERSFKLQQNKPTSI